MGQASVTAKTDTCVAACTALQKANSKFGKAKEALDTFNAENPQEAITTEARIEGIISGESVSASEIRELAKEDAERKKIQSEYDAAEVALKACATRAQAAYDALVDDYVATIQ